MAATTSNQAITDSAWSELSDGSSDVLVQIVSAGVVEVYVGTTEPGSATGIGHPISRSGVPFVAFSSLVTGDKVFARSHSGATAVRLTKT